MKKKLALCLAIVFVLAMVGMVLAACDNSKLSDEQLTALIGEVWKFHKDDAAITNENFGVIGKVSTGDGDNEVEANVKWTSSSDKVTISSSMSTTGYYQITVPDRDTLDADLAYTLTATLVDENGNEYKKESGEAYSVTFNRTVEKRSSSEPDAIMTFDQSSKATGSGEHSLTTSTGTSTGYAQVTWVDNGITLVNKATESSSPCAIYQNPARFYKSSTIEISYTEPIKAIRLTLNSSNSAAHATGFDGMSVEGATIKRVGDIAVISFANPVEKFVSAPLASQTRIDKVEVFTSYVPELEEETRYETEAEILEALKKLPIGETLPGGEYTLTGKITSIDTAYDASYGNITVTIEVGAEKLAIQCFRLSGGEDLKVGDEITVTGVLLNYKNSDGTGKLEFNSGCTYVKAGESQQESLLDLFKKEIITNPVVGTDYTLALCQISKNEVLYATGEMDGNFLGATTDVTKAAAFRLESATGGYFLKLGDKYITLTGSRNSKGNASAAISLTETASTVFVIGNSNMLLATLSIDKDGTPVDESFVLGTYGTYETISASSSYYVTGDKAADIDVSQFVARILSNNVINKGSSSGSGSGSGSVSGSGTVPEAGENVLARFTFGTADTSKTHTDGTGIPDGEDYEVGTVGDYTLTLNNPSKIYKNAFDEKGNSCIKLGTSKAFASFSFTVADNVQYVKIYVAKYKTYTSSIKVNGVQYDLESNSNDGEYDVIVVDVRTNKTVTFETCEWDGDTNFNGRCMITAIDFCSSEE